MLLLFTVVLSGALGWLGNTLLRVRHQRKVVAKIESLGGEAIYGYQRESGVHEPSPPGSLPLRMLFGDDIFADVAAVNLPRRTTDKDLDLLKELPELEEVVLDEADITVKGMKRLAAVEKLESVLLIRTDVTAAELGCLADAEQLSSLSLVGGAIDDDTLRTVDELSALESLWLNDTKVTSEGLAHVGRMTRLRELWVIGAPGVDDQGIIHLAGHSRLKVLSLQGTGVSDAGMHQMQTLPELRQLYLDGAKITDAGTIPLSRTPQLRELSLCSTGVSDAGLRRLAKLKNLKLLRVGPHVTRFAAEEVKPIRPDLRIEVFKAPGVEKFTLP